MGFDLLPIEMILPIVKPFLKPDKIRSLVSYFLNWIKNFQSEIVLDKSNGEKQITASFYTGDDGEDYFSVLILDENDIPVRTHLCMTVYELVEIIILKINDATNNK